MSASAVLLALDMLEAAATTVIGVKTALAKADAEGRPLDLSDLADLEAVNEAKRSEWDRIKNQ